MYKDIQNFVKKCELCQKCKYSNRNVEPMKITTTATSVFEKIFVDFVGPLECDEIGNNCIM